ncbi:MAG: ABC transporter ATP-binding protein [Spirochaetales bacterium]|nr:ABC transporter ATP-binding protein [Spirochaetales bacterium]
MLKLLKYLKPYWIPVTAVFILVFFQSMAQLYLPNLMSDIVNHGITNGDIDYIIRTGELMLLVALGGTVCAVLAGYLSAHAAMGLGEILRNRLFNHISGFSLSEFDKLGAPSLITRNTNDVTQIQMVVMIMLRMMITAPIMCIGGIIMAVSKDKGLSWVIIVVIPILAVIIALVASKGFPLFQSIQKKIDRINLVLREGLSGIRVIRAFNREDDEKKRFDDANLDLTKTSIEVNRLMALLMPLMMLIMNFTTIAIIWFGSIRVDSGVSNIGNMMAFLQYAMQILFSLLMAAMMFIMVPRAQASAERINEVLATRPEILDPEEEVRPSSEMRGYVEFRDVTYRYHGAEEPALRNISFKACPGEVTALIGSTGSGKTTLVNLIPRFYDVDSGQVLVDGVDVRSQAQEDLRARIGFVPQKAVLFSGTIAENIRYGKMDATDEEIRHAAEIAQATEFISVMKDGFDSEIAQGGTNVSGGQKQRLSIARALVRRPEVYVFDDSFSALDFKTDARLRAALKKEMADSTVIIIGQRVASIMDADRIIVLEEGRIAGMGTHKELYRDCRVYREIVASQLSEEEIA